MHRHVFRKLAENPDYIQTFWNDRRNLFHFACRKWSLYKNPQWCWSILTIMRIQLIGINIRIFVRVSEISVNIFENIIGKLLFSRPFYWYITLQYYLKFFIDIPSLRVFLMVWFQSTISKNHHWIELFKTFSTIYNMLY